MNKEQTLAIIQGGHLTDGDLADALLAELTRGIDPEAYMYHIKGNGKLTELAAIDYQEQFGETIIHRRALYSIPPPQPDLVAEIERLKALNVELTAKCNWYNADGARLERERDYHLDNAKRVYVECTELRQQLSAAQTSESELLKALETLANLYCYKSGNLYHYVTRVDAVATWEAAKKAIAAHKARKDGK